MLKKLDRRQLAMMLNYIGMDNMLNGINLLEDIYISHVGGVDLIPSENMEKEENLPDNLLILVTGGGRDSSFCDYTDLMTIGKVHSDQVETIDVDDERWHIFAF